MIKKLVLLAFVLSGVKSYAWEHESFIKGNLNIGATTPYSMPKNITVAGFNPLFTPSVSYEISVYRLNSLKVFTGLRYEAKGMHVKADVKGYYTEFYQNGSQLSGYFTGANDTKAYNSYMSLPVKAVYELNSKWSIYGGGYLSYNISSKFNGYARDGYIWIDNNTNKIQVTEGEFDFSKNVQKWDAGLEFGTKRMINSRFGVDVNLTTGLVPLFGKDFKSITFSMYNVFLGVGVSYKLK